MSVEQQLEFIETLKLEMLKVLKKAKRGKNRSNNPWFLTAYQVLNRLPEKVRNELTKNYGLSVGYNAGYRYSAATYVAQTLERMKKDVEITYLDNDELLVELWDGTQVRPGNSLCALYRIRGEGSIKP